MSALSARTGWQELLELTPNTRQRLVEFGAPLLLTEVEGRLALAERKIRAFEQKYGMTLTRLRRDGLPNDASIEMHEDFVEWSGWNRTCEETVRVLASLQPLVERAFVPVPAS